MAAHAGVEMHHKLLIKLFALPRPHKRGLQVLADAFLLTLSFAMAMLLRTETLTFAAEPAIWLGFAVAVIGTLLLFTQIGFYRAVVRYIGLRAYFTIFVGVAASAGALSILSYLADLPIPGTVPLIYALLALITVGGVRFGLRAIYHRTHSRDKTRVIVYGAGQSGRQTVHSLFNGREYSPVAFVDDKVELWGTQIAGLRVFSPVELEKLIRDYGAKVLLLAMPSVSRGSRANIIRRLEHLPVRIQTIPSMADIVAGSHSFNEVTEISIDDLLGRDAVPPDPELIGRNIIDKSVMVTGAGGSIGSELCRQILAEEPSTLVLVEHSEYALFEIGQELARQKEATRSTVKIVQVLASVRDGARLETVIRDNRVQTIYHAAAYKHVPMVEENAVEGVRNNVFGTLELAKAALACGVESFTLVSTDKAVRPTSVMGASKRLAEMICQALAQRDQGTRFSMVRFGNVLGSSGSVIPEFRRQIDAGGPVKVTHPEIMRYFMTITEAAQLVIQSSGLAQGGDVFLLDMGEPVLIRDLAARMIRLSGFTPVLPEEQSARRPADGKTSDAMPIVYTKLRKGEKLFEELFIGTIKEPTRHPRILTATETSVEWKRLAPILDGLAAACDAEDDKLLRELMMDAPIGYVPRRTGLSRDALERGTEGQKATSQTGGLRTGAVLPGTAGQIGLEAGIAGN